MENEIQESKKDWKKYHGQWAEITAILEEIVNNTALVKTFKWGGDVYTYEGKNILAFNGFKNHYALWFYQGVLLEDRLNVLTNASEGKTKGLRQWRFNSVNDLNVQLIQSYVEEAIQLAKDGKFIPKTKSIIVEPEGLLKERLMSDDQLLEAFNGLTPGRRKEYIEYIDEAKQDKTKITRLEKIVPLIRMGKGLNDQYKK